MKKIEKKIKAAKRRLKESLKKNPEKYTVWFKLRRDKKRFINPSTF